jgi:hypothetical protein
MKRPVCIVAGLMVFSVRCSPGADWRAESRPRRQPAKRLRNPQGEPHAGGWCLRPTTDSSLRLIPIGHFPADWPPGRQPVHQLRHHQGHAEPEPRPEQREEGHRG